ncbi:universal stress protein [Natronobacterium texcoconense]|uniref:Nucleotide-binding universal stress protein, UspA family n=1 Tax=Natronobacterium texcoconense TaxID=1095778 RepID=A0A1H1FXW0_NATTX|nr:universal stress protein [Natronobacterium texcoconense]SDR05619.1 Nucleotide-binding universal stress protein, UspA family [Natronobacterium texcoconense]
MTHRVLVAFDESPQSTVALRHALSTYDDSEIHMLHVTDLREWPRSDGNGGLSREEIHELSQDAAERLLEEATEIAREYDADVTTETATGKAAPTIVEYAEENDVDHIVLGSHGRRGLRRFLLGSVAEQVARRSPGTVTIVRQEQGDEET